MPDTHIVLLQPALSFLLLANEIEDNVRQSLPNFSGSRCSYVFVPVFGSDKTHWSLVVISITERLALHYTSSPAPHGNHAIIVSLTNKLASWFG